MKYYTSTAYLVSIPSSKWRKAVTLSLDPYSVPGGGSMALLLDAAPGAKEAGSSSTRKRWSNNVP
jgi:hypothetical protein